MIFPEVIVKKNEPFTDHRGELYSIYNRNDFDLEFNHDKVSISSRGVLRGLHGDSKSWKLITCLKGEVYFVVVDFRKESKNYLKWDSIILSQENKVSILVPPMFANGHLVLSESAIFFYKWSYSGFYPDVQDQFSINYKDPKIGIEWPINLPTLSDRDKNSKFLNE
jgi:dTDP-4-dehydrorhamnose 3,5-epimerase